MRPGTRLPGSPSGTRGSTRVVPVGPLRGRIHCERPPRPAGAPHQAPTQEQFPEPVAGPQEAVAPLIAAAYHSMWARDPESVKRLPSGEAWLRLDRGDRMYEEDAAVA